MPLQKARGFCQVAQHGANHHVMRMMNLVYHTTSAAAACSGSHAGRFLGDCIEDWTLGLWSWLAARRGWATVSVTAPVRLDRSMSPSWGHGRENGDNLYSQNIRTRFPTGGYAPTTAHATACLLILSYHTQRHYGRQRLRGRR